MVRRSGTVLRMALAALVATALATLGGGAVGHAQGGVYLTYSSGQADFEYPANWSGTTPTSNALVEYASPDGSSGVSLFSVTPDSPTAVAQLQSYSSGDAADPTDYPGFSVVKAPANVTVAGASDAATWEYVHTYTGGSLAGSLGHFWGRIAFRSDGSAYYLSITVPDAQLSQYQDQVNHILNSFALSS